MKSTVSNIDPTFSVMIMDLLSNVLSRAEHPGELGEYLTEEIRELSGARCVLFIECLSGVPVTAHRVIGVNPSRRRAWAESPAAQPLYDIVHSLPSAQLWRPGECHAATAILRTAGFELSLAVPLNVGASHVGAMLLLGLPDEKHLDSTVHVLDAISVILALVLRNSFLYERQEQVIQERTHELQAANDVLQENDLRIRSLLEDSKQAEVALLGLLEDQQQAEASLRVSEARFRSLIDQAGDGFELIDADGRYVEVNSATCRQLGYSREEMLRLSIPDIDPRVSREEYAARFQALVGQPPAVFESVHCRKDGARFPVEITVSVIQLGTALHALTLVRDITQRKRDDAELLKMDKLQSIGTLAGGIAHDFNNILQGLYGNINLAKDELASSHPASAFLGEVEKSMTRAIRLTRQLLTFSEGGDPVKESISLKDMVEEVARFDLTGSNVRLVYHHDADLWPVDADRGQIQQVISNLVINARQSMPKGGRLYITLENADLPDDDVIGLRKGRYVKVIVRDEGTGIDRENLNRIFDPYFTTKKTGSGLGLATVWSIVNRHGGHISVFSELGKGSSFTLYLPDSDLPQAVEAKPLTEECTVLFSPAKILVMDDEDSISRLVVRMLTPSGHTVSTAPDGDKAIALYRKELEAGDPFDVVIIDLTIPGGPGGKEVIQDLLKLDPRARAIVSSGYAADPVMANPGAYGFKGTVAKPYTSAALREAVARVLA